MKMFSIFAAIVGIIMTVLGIIDGNILIVFSSLSACISFVFLFQYSKNKSKKFINLSMIFLAIYTVLITVKMFTEKAYL